MAPKSSAVWITGSGLVSCAGNSPEELWSRICENSPGLDGSLGSISRASSTDLTKLALDFCERAARQAMAQANWKNINPDDGIILGTTTGQILAWDQGFGELLNGSIDADSFRKIFVCQPLGSLLNQVTARLGQTTHQQVLSTACTASTQALALATLWLKQGRVKRCLVGGVEVLCDLTVEGFKSLQLLAPTRSKPFSKHRNGINLSEGAAFVCLEKNISAGQSLTQISGLGMSSDAFHMTSPHPEGRGSQQAILLALKSAQLKPQQIDWIHAHGTGSFYNDLSEGLAIQAVFGKDSPFVCSTKSIHGHALGASGMIETIICMQALENQVRLRTPGLTDPDPAIPVQHLPSAHQSYPLRHILKMTLGFGGANAALVFSRAQHGTNHGL